MKKLFIFTDEFPYGKGEKTFLTPELESLVSHYDITIISMATDGMVLDTSNVSSLPHGIHLKRGRRFNPGAFIRGCLKMPFSAEGREEIARILQETSTAVLRVQRIVESIKQYGLACSIKKSYEKLGIFQDMNDAVYYSFWLNHCNLALALKKREVPQLAIISRVHGYDLYDERAPYSRQVFQWMKLAQSNKIIFAAQTAMDYFMERHHLSTESAQGKLVLSRIGSTRAETNHPKAPFSELPLIVSCSNAIPLKRVELIIEALALIPEMHVRWIHFGEGVCLDRLKALARSRRIDAEFRGFVHNDEIRRFYASQYVNAFITTSSTEGGCPVSITEALAFGIPIIGTDVGGIPEQIDGNGLLLASSPSAEDVAKAIRKILTTPQSEYEQMRARSQEIFDRRFNPKENIRTLEDAIASVSQR